MARAWLPVLTLLAALWTLPAQAWDTKEVSNHRCSEGYSTQWKSIYLCKGAIPNATGTSGYNRNEHAELADLVLRRIGLPHFTMANGEILNVYDLNTELFRSHRDSSSVVFNKNTQSLLEQRSLMPPPHWTGIPDFSYTIYDWINKNELCPSRPDSPSSCHDFTGWLGAGFNSSHFGSQAFNNYYQLHNTALWLAGRAKSLREALQNSDAPGDLDENEAFVKEREMMALAYEGSAQHFLEDRWAIGHMWERWGGPDYRQYQYRDSFWAAREVGAYSGLLHGSEAVTTLPDPMNSPTLTGNTLLPMQFRFPGSNQPVYGAVGDERLKDLVRGAMGKDYALHDYTDRPFNVTAWQGMMMTCLGAGWSEVVRGFGANPRGGFGIYRSQPTGAENFGATEFNCFNPWATNASIALGLGYDPAAIIGASARLTISGPGDARINQLRSHRIAWAKIAAWAAVRGVRAPKDIDLATGGMGDFGDAKPGNFYGAGRYLEPQDLSSLPRTDNTKGRDKKTIFGFFNRAHADYFCEDFDDFMDEYRGNEDAKDQEICQLLADRVYDSTDPEYQGVQKEERKVAWDSGADRAHPICWHMTGSARIRFSEVREDKPLNLRPGYVPFAAQDREGAPYTKTPAGHSTQSIANWCNEVPVLDLKKDKREWHDGDVVAVVTGEGETLEVKGVDLGRTRGKLSVGQIGGAALDITEIESWGDKEIRFRLPEEGVPYKDNEVYLFVEDADGKKSAGRFVIRREIRLPEIIKLKVWRTEGQDEEFYEFEQPAAGEREEDWFGYRDMPLGQPPEEAAKERLPPFRPITPGKVKIELEFDRDMNRNEEETSFKLGTLDIEGNWRGKRRWRGEVEIPKDKSAFQQLRGFVPISVKALSEEGGWSDADLDTPGVQPNETHKVLVDATPRIVEKIEVRAGGSRIYLAEWEGGPDLAEQKNLTAEALGDPKRTLIVRISKAMPEEGEGEIRIWLSEKPREGDEQPAVWIGTGASMLEKDGDLWRGTFDVAKAKAGESFGLVPLYIAAIDSIGNGLDGDPRTVTRIGPPETDTPKRAWVRYEDGRNGPNSDTGGQDSWHEIGPPPELSLVIVLDASGSMGEGTPPLMERVKQGIRTTLDSLPRDQAIEVGAVVFYSCGSISNLEFTRDLDAIRDRLMSVGPSGGTPYAGAIDQAAGFFKSSAHPASKRWRYAPFTDGLETCDGNVVGASNRLEDAIARHNETIENMEPPEPEPPQKPPLPQVDCQPDTWRVYQTEVEDGGLHLDRITLIEHYYWERKWPDGRCMARLRSQGYGVYYGQVQGEAGQWGVNSRHSGERIKFSSSAKGKAQFEALRSRANALRAQSGDKAKARREIDAAVRASLQRNSP